jgi:HSP20 family molecular chaperone IbpA
MGKGLLGFTLGNQGDKNAERTAEPSDPAGGALLSEGGVYLAPGRSSWQIGQLCLLPGRLVFEQPRGVLFDMPLDWLVDVRVERKHYVVVRKPVMAVTFHDPRLRKPSTAWFLTPMLGQWLARLAQGDGSERSGELADESKDVSRTQARWHADYDDPPEVSTHRRDVPARRHTGNSGLQIGSLRGADRLAPAVEGRVLRPPQASVHTSSRPAVTSKTLARLAKQLDPAGRAILSYLAENGHATIRELADLIGANSDMDVLYAIRQGINPTAQELLGRPVLFFVESQADQVTGEMVSYAWWLAGSKGRAPASHAVEAEVYDEGEFIAVVLDLCGAEERSICCRAEGGHLIVTAEGDGRRWCSEVELPAPVNPTPAVQQYRNGIVSIQLAKMGR